MTLVPILFKNRYLMFFSDPISFRPNDYQLPSTSPQYQFLVRTGTKVSSYKFSISQSFLICELVRRALSPPLLSPGERLYRLKFYHICVSRKMCYASNGRIHPLDFDLASSLTESKDAFPLPICHRNQLAMMPRPSKEHIRNQY